MNAPDPASEGGRPGPASGFGLLDVRFRRASLRDLTLWYAVSSVLVFVLPSMFRLGGPPWALSAALEIQAWYWALASLLTATGVVLYRAIGRTPSPMSIAVLGMGPWALAALALFIRSDIPSSRVVALMSFLLACVLAIVPVVLATSLGLATALVATASAVLVGLESRRATPDAALGGSASPGAVIAKTALLPVSVTYERRIIPDPVVNGGAIAPVGAGFLLATAEGHWFQISWDSTGTLHARALSIPAPMRRDGVVIDSAGAFSPLLRITGLVVDTTVAGVTAYVAHEVWRPDERCVALQVSAMQLEDLSAIDRSRTWRTVYTTLPCVKPGAGFDPYESGGRLAMQPDHSLLLTVGDYGLNQVMERAVAQQPGSDYGKTLRIGLDGSRTLFTSGHRNPQGVTIDLAGNVWVAEHGPRGGDEINLLKSGANYGWPIVSYGTDYRGYRWYGGSLPHTHGPYEEPALALHPSLGISAMATVRRSLFTSWTGDLLVGSLDGGQLLRVRLSGERAVYFESIPIGLRIRDVAEGADGRIVLWTDQGVLVRLSPAAALLDGARVYESCSRCHRFEGTGRAQGPSLIGMFDRGVASAPDFAYSAAFRRLVGRWTDERLDAFLKSPATFAPGTTMNFPGIADSTERRILIRYLHNLASPAR